MKYIFIVFTLLLFSSLHAQNMNLEWARNIGDINDDYSLSVAVDASGNVYTTGAFRGIADFDPGPGTYNLTSAGGRDVFVSKVNASGNFVWAKNMGGATDDVGYAIAVDAAGNVLTTGAYSGTGDFDPGAATTNLTSAGGYDIFVSKLDASGNLVWVKSMGGTAGDECRSLAVDVSGNVYTTGYFNGTSDFDPGASVSNLTTIGVFATFISKLDASGNFVWAKTLDGSSTNYGQSIAVDALGNVYTTGAFTGTVDFAPGPFIVTRTSAGGRDIFISKLNASGTFVWALNMGGTTDDVGYSIKLDASGNIYTTGAFFGTADFQYGPATNNITSAGDFDIFVTKLDPSGILLWAKGMGGTGDDEGLSLAVDNAGNVYTTGIFMATSDFNPGAATNNLTSAGYYDIFVSKLDPSGNFVEAINMGGAASEYGQSIATDALGNLYISGDFYGTADFDPGAGTNNLTPVGSGDIFVLKLSQGGYLPINLLLFTAQKVQNDVVTNWRTANQLNFSHFEIERSLDATHFEKAGMIQPISGSGVLNYQFKDFNSLNTYKNSGRLFYRLKMIDRDGTTTYSKIARVDIDKKYTVHVYPNPAINKIYVEGIDNYKSIRINDVSGKVVYDQKVTQGSINISHLSKGVYTILLSGDDDVQSLRFVKK
ncbi:MAG: SBBP repeat-containing protein [Chitinophagaceae bacterium]|nr:SBBP repeat-containing protein [Chitinophagaceae bacterium]